MYKSHQKECKAVLEWATRRLPEQGVLQRGTRVSDINFCLLVLPIIKKKKPPLFSKSDQEPASLLVGREPWRALLSSSSLLKRYAYKCHYKTSTKKEMKWSPRKDVCHGSVVYSCSREDAKEPAIKSVIIMSPLLLTYSLCKLCKSLWTSSPLAARSRSSPYAQPAITLYSVCTPPLFGVIVFWFYLLLKGRLQPLAGTQISSIPFLWRLFPVFHYSYQSC